MNDQLQAWHNQSPEDVLDAFSVTKNGLTNEQAEVELEEYGENILPSKKQKTLFDIFIAQFQNPLIIILVFAAGISFVLQEWLDVFVIFFAVFLNTGLGLVEEYKADRALHALKTYLPNLASVRRGGKLIEIEAREIVPGDILIIRSGDKISADSRIIEESDFETNESALTGESMSIKKQTAEIDIEAGVSDRNNMVFAGSVAFAGAAEAVVVATGIRTEIGKISQLVETVEVEQTPMQKKINRFSKQLGLFVLVLATLIIIFGVMKGFGFIEMLEIGVALAVSAIPEGLVVAVTVVLAIGMQKILKRRALVRKLVASETLGSVSVICMDKTGTITEGVMSLTRIFDINGELNEGSVGYQDILQDLNFISGGSVQNGDKDNLQGTPTEKAILKFLLEKNAYSSIVDKTVLDLPFNSRNKFSARLVKDSKENIMYALGAPEILMKRLDISDSERKKILGIFKKSIEEGRVLMLASSKNALVNSLSAENVKDLKFVGFFVFLDPIRSEARKTIENAKAAGLRPIIITGDNAKTALSIAVAAGFNIDMKRVMTGDKLEEMSDRELEASIYNFDVYARVMPEHKVRIVSAWKNSGASVAMVGDGVNDAPAIKIADIGIALGSGTEVAKETADIVLLDNNFATIISAIREGRIIFDNIRKMIVYLLADSFSEILLIIGALIFSLPLPILPAQILWINLISDGFPSVALAFEPGEKNIMKEPPLKKSEPILNLEMKLLIFLVGAITSSLLFVLYFYFLGKNLSIEEIRTFIFVTLGLDSLIYVFAVRKFRSSVFTSNPFENKLLVLAVFAGFFLQIFPLIFVPLRELFMFTVLTPIEWGAAFGWAFFNLLLIEAVKFPFVHSKKPQKSI